MPFLLAVTDPRNPLAFCGSQGLLDVCWLCFPDCDFLWIFLDPPSLSSLHSESAGLIRLQKTSFAKTVYETFIVILMHVLYLQKRHCIFE